MADGFHHLSFGPDQLLEEFSPDQVLFRAGLGADAGPPSTEQVARYFLDLAFTSNRVVPSFRGFGLDAEIQPKPSMAYLDSLQSPFDQNQIVRFQQTHERVPVYGSRATVELKNGESLAHLDANYTETNDIEQTIDDAPMSPSVATERLADQTNIQNDTRPPEPTLIYFRPSANAKLALCYLFEAVSLSNPDPRAVEQSFGGWESAPARLSSWDVFLDAFTGNIITKLSVSRSLSIVDCDGQDESNILRQFQGSKVANGFSMRDLPREVVTYDYALQSYQYTDPPLGDPVTNPTTSWAATNRAAVAADYHATRVHDFFESVLHRQGVDGNKMQITSVVNCATPDGNQEWTNAQWTGTRMIYGQTLVNGQLVSLARFLEVIAHELTHGITQCTARLDYEFQSGALNESMSDIFGIIVANWAAGRTDPRAAAWSWEIGHGLGYKGLLLRDMRDPTKGSPPQPAHMDQWVTLSKDEDSGGVHANSGIHNKAACEVLIGSLADGQLAFMPTEVASFYYYVLVELTHNGQFSDVRTKLIEIVRDRKQGSPNLNQMLDVIKRAYDGVGVI